MTQRSTLSSVSPMTAFAAFESGRKESAGKGYDAARVVLTTVRAEAKLS